MSGKRRYSLTKDSTKKCSKCGQFKNVAEFGWANKKLGYKQAHCRKCSKNKVTEFYQRRKTPVYEYLKGHPCVDCGEDDYRILEFDHVRGEKSFNVSGAWANKKRSEIEEEIKKCDIRCKNCHAIRHWNEGWGGGPPITSKDAIEYYNIEDEDKPPDLQMKLF